MSQAGARCNSLTCATAQLRPDSGVVEVDLHRITCHVRYSIAFEATARDTSLRTGRCLTSTDIARRGAVANTTVTPWKSNLEGCKNARTAGAESKENL